MRTNDDTPEQTGAYHGAETMAERARCPECAQRLLGRGPAGCCALCVELTRGDVVIARRDESPEDAMTLHQIEGAIALAQYALKQIPVTAESLALILVGLAEAERLALRFGEGYEPALRAQMTGVVLDHPEIVAAAVELMAREYAGAFVAAPAFDAWRLDQFEGVRTLLFCLDMKESEALGDAQCQWRASRTGRLPLEAQRVIRRRREAFGETDSIWECL